MEQRLFTVQKYLDTAAFPTAILNWAFWIRCGWKLCSPLGFVGFLPFALVGMYIYFQALYAPQLWKPLTDIVYRLKAIDLPTLPSHRLSPRSLTILVIASYSVLFLGSVEQLTIPFLVAFALTLSIETLATLYLVTHLLVARIKFGWRKARYQNAVKRNTTEQLPYKVVMASVPDGTFSYEFDRSTQQIVEVMNSKMVECIRPNTPNSNSDPLSTTDTP